VVGRAVSLPLAAGAIVTLLHVVPRSLPIRARHQAEKEGRTALATEAMHVSKALGPDITVKHTVSVGPPPAEIADHASRLKADLVVMGRGRGRPLRDSLLGSTAERVVRQAKTPILVIRLPARAPYRRPTLGLDLDAAAEAVLGMLLRVIPPPRPRVAIVHAHDAPYLGMAYAGMAPNEIEEEEHRYRPTAVAQLAQVVARVLQAQKRTADEMPGFKTYIRFGDPRSAIKAVVKKLDTDLLLLGTHGYSGISRIFLGTVAGEILRDVRCDVLVVPPRRQTGRRS
jgi:nucleotide-binding universal stress UspA family protein